MELINLIKNMYKNPQLLITPNAEKVKAFRLREEQGREVPSCDPKSWLMWSVRKGQERYADWEGETKLSSLIHEQFRILKASLRRRGWLLSRHVQNGLPSAELCKLKFTKWQEKRFLWLI